MRDDLHTRRRLRTGAHAKAVIRTTPKTEAEIRSQLDDLHDGIAALQSLDDLGSTEENAAVMKDIDVLMKRHKELEQRLKDPNERLAREA